MEFLHEFVNWANGLLWGNVLIYLLIGAGLYFTVRTGLAQLRLLPQGVRQMMGGRAHQSARDISPF